MARTLLIMCLAAASLAAKDRAWQTGVLLNKDVNPYFKTTQVSEHGVKTSANASFTAGDNGVMAVDTRASSGDVSYDDFVVQGTDTVYLVEYGRFKGFPAPNINTMKPFTFAVEKSRLYIRDLDHHEFETSILKQTERRAPGALASAASAAAAVDKSKAAASKSEDLFARGTQNNDEAKPKPAPAPVKPVAAQKPAPTAVAASVKEVKAAPKDVKPAPKPEPKVEAAVTKPAPKPAAQVPVVRPEVKPVAKPEPKVEASVTKPAPARPEGPVVRPSTKDRPWQAGQLLSVANNNYFFNVTYTSDEEGSNWPFSQGSDGRMTVTGQIAANTSSYYTYDNYVIESEYVAYLVQRMRPKTSQSVRLPGTKALKFAVDKNKMWVVDEQGIEYEFKVVKLIQKDAIVDLQTTRTAAR